MNLLVTSVEDAAGTNMAQTLFGAKLSPEQGIQKCDEFDILAINGPSISADSLEAQLDQSYDGIIFLSKHAAVSGKLALTCHSTGNFTKAKLGGRDFEVAIPYTQIIKNHIQALWNNRADFVDFDITLEATHHGPTGLHTPSAFIEVGTTNTQWNDAKLCANVATILRSALSSNQKHSPSAICFGGNHYPKKFTTEAIHGEFATGTIVPKYSLECINDKMMSHIVKQNLDAKVALIDSNGLGESKSDILELVDKTDLEVIKL